MLVLTRKPGETILIGDDIVIYVTSIDRNKVKIGIQAPRSVPVVRGELERPKDVRDSSPSDPPVRDGGDGGLPMEDGHGVPD